MTQPSPFTPGAVASTLPGRAAQLAQVDESLDQLRARRLVQRIRVDHGPRGYGKTSLLREYQRRAEAHRLLAVWVTAGERPLVQQLLAQLRPHVPNDLRRRIRDHVDIVEVQAGAGPIGHVRAQVRPGDDRGGEAPSALVKEAVIAVADGAPHRGLVLLIDEVQSGDAEGLRALAYAWQDLQAEAPDVPAAAFTAGLPAAPDVISAAVTFAERFSYRRLEPLDPDAEILALTGPAADLGVSWDNAALDRALEIAGGFPYFVQLVGDHTWHAASDPDSGGRLRVADVEEGFLRMREDLDALYRARWAQATPAERNLMRVIAEHHPEPTPRARLAEALGVPSSALSVPRQRLIDKGMISAAGRGTLEFTLPGFADYVSAREG